MTKGQIARMVTMILIALLLVLAVWGYGTEIGKVVKPIEYADNVNVDGADFTGIMNLLVAGTNGLVGLVIGLSYCIVLSIIALVLLLPWGLIVGLKKSEIAPVELNVAVGTFIGVVFLSMVMGFVGAHFSSFLIILLMTLVVAVMFGLLCFLPYWLAYRRCKKAEMNYES